MKKLFAFIAFMYHLHACQRPVKLMKEAHEECIRIVFENGSTEELVALTRRIDYCVERLDYHLAKCEKYQVIIDA